MTVTIANVSLPQMQGSLSATQDQIAWVVTFNIVATAVVTPTAGWLAAHLGRRRVMIIAVTGFGVASILCGLAGSVEELVLYRIFQGAFGAPMVPLSQAILLDTYPKKKHNTVTAIWGVGVILGPIVAPALGGILSEAYNWRWVFFMKVVWIEGQEKDGEKGQQPAQPRPASLYAFGKIHFYPHLSHCFVACKIWTFPLLEGQELKMQFANS